MQLKDKLTKYRYKYFPDHVIGELLSKEWVDNSIPMILLVLTLGFVYVAIPDFYSVGNLTIKARELSEIALIVLAMAIVIIAGGIDLSVGSVLALSNFVALYSIRVNEWSPLTSLIAIIAVGAVCGAINGFLIGYMRLRAFLTTLVTLIIIRAIVDLLLLKYGTAIAISSVSPDSWIFIGEGSVYGIPVSFCIAMIIIFVWYLIISRSRPGWHIVAVGSERRSAYNAGLNVRRTIFFTYFWSSILCAIAGFFYASRLGGAGSDTGKGLEIIAITAAVLGGNSLGGGRGSVGKAFMGTIIIITIIDTLVTKGISGGKSSMILGLILLFAVVIDVRWLKNRYKVIKQVYISPAYYKLAPCPDTAPNNGTVYAQNDKLKDAEVIGLGILEGPEDIIFDKNDNLYTGNRHGDIFQFFPPDYTRYEIRVHIGGNPLGHAMDSDGNHYVCVGMMGLYVITPDGTVKKVTDETNRSWTSVIDDSRMRLADDLDIAPDGRIFFSEATVRHEMHDWPVDALECRGNGRIIEYNPSTKKTRTVIRHLRFSNGVCMSHDNESFFFAETWGCRINRYWFAGPKKGKIQWDVIPDLPGYPDNINRASDGNYWLAMVGMRSPAFDLAMELPGFRKRMVDRISNDEWLFPNMNRGCVIKFNDMGKVLESLWDRHDGNFPMITSMREHRGYLYLGGLLNNRIGRYRLPGADPNWTSNHSYWGKR